MSGVTVPLGFPYPTDADFVTQGDEAIQALAEAVDDSIAGSDAAIAAGANINLGASPSRAYRRGRVGLVTVIGIATTAALAAGANLFTLPVGYRPVQMWYGTLQNNTGATVLVIQVNTDGTCLTSQAIPSGHLIYGAIPYPL